MSSQSSIIVKGLKKSFKDVTVLSGIDLEVQKGQVLALLGPNGAGKTTTVRILSTLLPPDSGDAFINGHSVVKDPDKVRASIGLTGQYAAVDEYLTGYENLEMMGRLYHLGRDASRKRANELLHQFDLEKAASRMVKTYSGGMRRRLDLAASLIATPPILFLDEPTTGLDPRSRLAMWGIIKKLLEADVTILLTTQYLEEADTLADRIAVLDHGRIIVEGTATELKNMVGRERLEFTMNSPQDLEKALTLLESETVKGDKEKQLVSIATDGSVKDIKEALAALEKGGVEPVSLSVHQPTLDDVFLQFTGHGASPQEATDQTSHSPT